MLKAVEDGDAQMNWLALECDAVSEKNPSARSSSLSSEWSNSTTFSTPARPHSCRHRPRTPSFERATPTSRRAPPVAVASSLVSVSEKDTSGCRSESVESAWRNDVTSEARAVGVA